MNFSHCSRASKPFYACKNHSHNAWEIIYQTMGKTRAVAGDKEFEMSEGDVLVIPPGTVHRTESDTYITDMWISFEKYEFPTFPFMVKDTDGNIRKLFEMLFEIYDEQSKGVESFTERLTELICLYVKKANVAEDVAEIIGIVKDKLKENISNSDFDVTAYILSLGYNQDYFRRLFKKYTSVSPSVYLNNLRMEKAKELIFINPFFSILEISSLCGFKDSLYFSSCFKQYAGVSPSQYKKSITQ